jgi:hypothetical protein
MSAGRFVGLVAFACSSCLWARPALAIEPPTSISVLTMGPGQHPFTRFGHNALLLEWRGANGERDLVYNFGTFEFRGARGVLDFMAGEFRYWLSVSTLERTRATYGAAGRSLVAQELDLDRNQRAELARALALNSLPEHRYYDYDYYRDNCSTRVRDALDSVLGGGLSQQVQGPGRFSFRQHTLRLLGDAPWLYFGLDLALGAPTDRATTRHEELFLPGELHDELAQATITREGRALPLVRRELRLLESELPNAPSQPPDRRAQLAGVGLALGVLGAVLGRAGAKRRALRVAFGAWSALLGLSAGLLGTVLAGFWMFSKHWAAHRNYSLLLCPPWALWLGLCGVGLALGRARAREQLNRAAALLVGSSALALLLSTLPNTGYASQELPLTFLPLWLGVLVGAVSGTAWGAWRAPTAITPSTTPLHERR